MLEKRVLVLDDDEKFTSELTELLNDTECDIKFLIDSTNVSTDRKIITGDYDIYFLDIDMPDKSGFDIARELNNRKDVLIVFVTDHNDLVYSALEMKPFYFVRKNNLNDDMAICIRLINEKFVILERKFEYNYNNDIISFNYKDIVFFKQERNMIHLNAVDDDYYLRMTMTTLENIIDHPDFVRTHKSYIINMNYIEAFNSRFILIDNKEFPLGRAYANIAKDTYHDYLRRK